MVDETAPQPQYEPALGMSRGRTAMWLFIASEAMFFTALVAAYLVLRFAAEEWPSGASMHASKLIGIANTVVLFASSASVSVAIKKLVIGNRLAARTWLLLAVLLGAGFMAVKGYEYREKFRHNLYPANPHGPVYDEADAYYLSAVRARVQQLSESYREQPDDEEAAKRLSWLDKFSEESLQPAEVGLRDVPVSTAAEARCRDVAESIYDPVGGESLNEEQPWLRLPIVIPGGRMWISTYFLLTGAHLVHLLVAMVVALWWVLVGVRDRTLGALRNLSLYWQFVDVVWVVLLAIIYFT